MAHSLVTYSYAAFPHRTRRCNLSRWCSFKSRRPLVTNADRSDQMIAGKNTFKMNLSEYLVTLDRPLGIRFGQMLNGKVYVDALVKEGKADANRLIMVGDIIKTVLIGGATLNVHDFGSVINEIRTSAEPITLVLERSGLPPSIQSLIFESKMAHAYNHGRVAVATWNNANLSYPYGFSAEEEHGGGNVGFAIFTWKYLLPGGLKNLNKLTVAEGNEDPDARGTPFELIATYTDGENDVVEWTRGSYPLEEFRSARARAASDLTYNRKFGLQYTKLTDHVFVGSCLENGTEILQLKELGITAILDLQSESEKLNWGVDSKSITGAASDNKMTIASCPIRDVDALDLRRKLPLAVATLYRLLRLGHRVYVMCTSGLDRSPACVIGYFHWIRDVPLQNALDFVTNLHPCAPDRAALAWATWDLVALAEKENIDGPPTHAVKIVWNHGCKEGEEVLIVGDFKGEWNEPIKASHVSGTKYEVDLRLRHGKYYYKFIVGGQWRHSNSLPTEVDRWGNVNNIIVVGGKATARFESLVERSPKDLATVRVMERPLTEEERLMLAFAARRMAFSVCPLRLAAKRE